MPLSYNLCEKTNLNLEILSKRHISIIWELSILIIRRKKRKKRKIGWMH